MSLAFVQKNNDSAVFSEILAKKITVIPATTMLTSGIKTAYEKGALGLQSFINL